MLDRRNALLKAVIDTPTASAGLLNPTQSSSFIRTLKEKAVLSNEMGQLIRVSSSGVINKVTTGTRLTRAASENSDDGYRVGATFGTVPYATKKLRLPWEVTEDVFHENIEGEGFETTMVDEMTQQFAYDLEDLGINGDTSQTGDPFIGIDDGILKIVSSNAGTYPARNVNAGAATIDKSMLFDSLYAMPNKYRARGGLRWIMSPNRAISYWETLTNRATPGGDSLLTGPDPLSTSPLGVPVLQVPAMPDNVILLADPSWFIRVITWDVRRRRVTGETDAELAALDKRFYLFFIKVDTLVQELDAVVRLYNIGAV